MLYTVRKITVSCSSYTVSYMIYNYLSQGYDAAYMFFPRLHLRPFMLSPSFTYYFPYAAFSNASPSLSLSLSLSLYFSYSTIFHYLYPSPSRKTNPILVEAPSIIIIRQLQQFFIHKGNVITMNERIINKWINYLLR